ncbi:MAG: hypothetical protein FD144_2242 [Rhodospirillaceae bacterium]|nr:MAG: hypothetical protein FD144_2242 [Rhodospirillaceae bacterium]
MSIQYFMAYYAAYVALSLGITVWVGNTLSKNGLVFLVENFEGREELARSVNHLLLVGFYLINVGFITLMLRYGGRPDGLVEAVEYLSTKIGLVVVLLGIMHFTNMYVLMRFRKSALFGFVGPKTLTRTAAGRTVPIGS